MWRPRRRSSESCDTPDQLTTAIGRYQRNHGLPEDEVVLKRAVLPGFHRPNDPIVVIRGTKDRPGPPEPEGSAAADPHAVREGAHDDSEQDEDPPLDCRWPDALVSGVRVAGDQVSATDAQTPKPPNLPSPDGLSGVPSALLRELLHLASSNARTLATSTGFTSDVTALAEAMRTPHVNAVGTPGEYTAQWPAALAAPVLRVESRLLPHRVAGRAGLQSQQPRQLDLRRHRLPLARYRRPRGPPRPQRPPVPRPDRRQDHGGGAAPVSTAPCPPPRLLATPRPRTPRACSSAGRWR